MNEAKNRRILATLSRYRWREVAGVIEVKIEQEVLASFDAIALPDLIEKVAGLGLKDAQLEVARRPEPYSDYETAFLQVTGWRAASEAEIQAALAEVEEREARARAFQDQQIAALKQSRPELFKE